MGERNKRKQNVLVGTRENWNPHNECQAVHLCDFDFSFSGA